MGCMAGFYKNLNGSSPCTKCPSNAFSMYASSHCSCRSGEWEMKMEREEEEKEREGAVREERMRQDLGMIGSKSFPNYARSVCVIQVRRTVVAGYRRSKDDDVNLGCFLRGAVVLESTRTFKVDVSMSIMSFHLNLSAVNQSLIDSLKQTLLRQVSLFFDASQDSVTFDDATRRDEGDPGHRREEEEEPYSQFGVPGWDDLSVQMSAPVTDDLDTFQVQQVEIQALLSEFLGPSYVVKSMAMTCGQGHYLSSANICEECPEGKYKSSILNDDCVVCPEHSTSLTAGKNITYCTCNAGYEALSNQTNMTEMNFTVANSRQFCRALAQTVSKEGAQQAATAASSVIGAVVAVNVGVGVGSAVAGAAAGGAGGGAGGGGGGGGGGGCLALITQVQMLNQLGKVGGKSSDAGGLSSFSKGFGWSNFQFGLADSLGFFNNTNTTGTRRKITKKFDAATNKTIDVTASCEFFDIAPKMETLAVCVGILIIVYLFRNVVGLIVVWCLKKERPTSLMFPSWEVISLLHMSSSAFIHVFFLFLSC